MWPILCVAHDIEQVLFILSQAVRAPDVPFFLCLFQPNLISKLCDSLYIPPLTEVSPPLPAWSHFSECLCFWEFRVELEVCSEGCKWGMDVCTCRSLSATCSWTGNLLPAFLPFPCPFYAFAYPRKPAHCQNRTPFKHFVWCFCFTWKSKTCKCQYLGGKKTPKTSWVCFIWPFPKENQQDKHNGKNAWSALWGLLNDSNRGQKCQVLYSTMSADLKNFQSNVWNSWDLLNTDFLLVYIKISSFKNQIFW